MHEIGHDRGTHGKGDEHDNPEGMWFTVERQFVIFEVHPIGRENHGRDRHDDGHQSQGFHDIVLVIRNDRGKGLRHTVEDVTVDISHLNGLLGLNQGVFQQVLVFQIFLDIAGGAGQLLNHALICLKRGLEIDDGLFQLHEFNQFFISRGLVQLAFNLLTLAINGAQGCQI